MDDGYGTCTECPWAGKLRKDGTMRKHREAANSGRVGSTGSLMQQRHGDICKGSYHEPHPLNDLGEGSGVDLRSNQHGGWDLGAVKAVEGDAKRRYFVDLSDPSYPRIRPAQSAPSGAELVTFAQAKREIAEALTRRIEHFRTLRQEIQSLRAPDADGSD